MTEQSPAIDDVVIDVFRSRFKEYDVAKPAIANGLDKCTIFKKHPGTPVSAGLSIEPDQSLGIVDP